MTQNFEWRPFLERWSADRMAVAAHEDLDEELGGDVDGDLDGDLYDGLGEGTGEESEERSRTGWLGFEPAGGARIAALERRLGLRLPPSYRSFLAVTDGWLHATRSVHRLAAADEVAPHGDPSGLREVYEAELTEDSAPQEVLLAGMWERSLQLAADADGVDVLLDPGDVAADGEWAVYVHKALLGGDVERYASFAAFMQHMFRALYCDHGDNHPDFVTPTLREVAAAVERAWQDALAGAIEGPWATLRDARAYGGARAHALATQFELLLGGHGLAQCPSERRLTDPWYAGELLPLFIVQQMRMARDERALVGLHAEEDRGRVATLFAEIAAHTFRYEAPGPFGAAVATAREQARWGGTEEAWRTIAAALPAWEPYDERHLAPIGLLADPLLGPLLTPERRRQLLATPRAGQRGRPAGHAAPGGLADGPWVGGRPLGPSRLAGAGVGPEVAEDPGAGAGPGDLGPGGLGLAAGGCTETGAGSTAAGSTDAGANPGVSGSTEAGTGPAVAESTSADAGGAVPRNAGAASGRGRVAGAGVGGPGRGTATGAGAAPGRGGGLAWLAAADAPRESYRFILLRDRTPSEAAQALGTGPLFAPYLRREWSWLRATGVPAGDDGHRPILRVGAGGAGWSFGFDDDPEPFPTGPPGAPGLPGAPTPLGERASLGGAALTIWCQRPAQPSAAFPHALYVDYAEDGRQRFGFVLRGTAIERTGAVPDALAPERFCAALDGEPDVAPGVAPGAGPVAGRGPGRDAEAARAREQRVLAAVAEFFGVSLPRFALLHGRLHVVRSKPWSGPSAPHRIRATSRTVHR
ncbi:SMI1/KNR4 family protein [Streptomyces sp. 796.1]|uniref:SMI1/KNR4 family protein n=1 Tax=Streptomyces sp. 796.1 TaxID=3163029 RepID=UPI0039C9AD5C